MRRTQRFLFDQALQNAASSVPCLSPRRRWASLTLIFPWSATKFIHRFSLTDSCLSIASPTMSVASLSIHSCPQRLIAFVLAFNEIHIKHRFNQEVVHAVNLHMAYFNFCWRPGEMRVTPAQAAGLTGHCWTFDELLAQMAGWPRQRWRGFFMRWRLESRAWTRIPTSRRGLLNALIHHLPETQRSPHIWSL